MPKLARRDACTACTACMATCPRGCISMVRDDEGFLQPSVGEGCVECGACTRACPLLSGMRGNDSAGQVAVAAIAKDGSLWRESSSGGAFTCLCEAFASLDPSAETVVFGAAMEFPRVVHIERPSSNLSDLRRSKYVQSDMGDCLRAARHALRDGKRVVFSGTPCQVAGAASFLRGFAGGGRILLVDLICHGAGSPAVFERCMGEASARMGKVVGYSFRNKVSLVGNYERYLSKYEYLDRYLSVKTKDVLVDDYNQLFLSQLCLRRSCAENCPFRTRERFGDVTLADLNGKSVLFPDLADPRGWSTVVASTDVGREVVAKLTESMDVLESTPDDVARFNPLFERTTPGNPDRNAFFEDFCAGVACSELVERYAPRKANPVGFLLRHTPWSLKRAAWVLLRRLRRRGK